MNVFGTPLIQASKGDSNYNLSAILHEIDENKISAEYVNAVDANGRVRDSYK